MIISPCTKRPFALLFLQENSDLLSSVKTLESRSWRLEEDLRQAESMAGLRDPRSGRRKASRDLLVQTVTRQADTIARLQDQIRTLQEVRGVWVGQRNVDTWIDWIGMWLQFVVAINVFLFSSNRRTYIRSVDLCGSRTVRRA